MVDNGKGIDRNDLNIIGERYVTSKCHTLEDLDQNLQHLGYRGEALASIVNVSGLVEISSRHHLSQRTFCKVFRNGEDVGIIATSNQRPSVGTTVTVHDVFHNIPVRRKTITDVLELEQIRKTVESIALVNPSISFSVRNDVTGSCILQTHKTPSVLTNFGLLFASSKICGMKDISTCHAGFNISGFISTETHHSKSLQFIFVNKRIVKKTPLHACVNKVLNNSLLTKRQAQQRSESKWKGDFKNKEFPNPRRSLDRYPVYVLMIECPRSEYDVCLEPAKTLIEFKHWDDVLTSLTLLSRKFLDVNNLSLGILPASSKTQELQDGTGSSWSSQEASTDYEPWSVDLEGASSFRPSLQSRAVKHPKVKEITVPAAKQPQIVEGSANNDLIGSGPVTKTAEDQCSHNYSASERMGLSCDEHTQMEATNIEVNPQPKTNATRLYESQPVPHLNSNSLTPSVLPHSPLFSCPSSVQSTHSNSYLVQEPNSLFILPYNSPGMSYPTHCHSNSITTSLNSFTNNILAPKKTDVNISSSLRETHPMVNVRSATPQSSFTVSSKLDKLSDKPNHHMVTHANSNVLQTTSSPLNISRVPSQGVFKPIYHSTPSEIKGDEPATLESLMVEPSLCEATTTCGLGITSISQLSTGQNHTNTYSCVDHSAVGQNVITVPSNDSGTGLSSMAHDKEPSLNPISYNTSCTVESVTAEYSTANSQNDEYSVCDKSMSCKPIWKQVVDPISGRIIFIHSTTGNCSYTNPVSTSLTDTHSINDTHSDYTDSAVGDSVSNTLTCTSSLGMRPLKGAPHLSHDYQPFMPRLRKQRIPTHSENNTSKLSELVNEHGLTTPTSDLTCKWRDYKELNGLSLSHDTLSLSHDTLSLSHDTGDRIGRTFETLLKEWVNPTFQAGQEVRNGW